MLAKIPGSALAVLPATTHMQVTRRDTILLPILEQFFAAHPGVYESERAAYPRRMAALPLYGATGKFTWRMGALVLAAQSVIVFVGAGGAGPGLSRRGTPARCVHLCWWDPRSPCSAHRGGADAPAARGDALWVADPGGSRSSARSWCR